MKDLIERPCLLTFG